MILWLHEHLCWKYKLSIEDGLDPIYLLTSLTLLNVCACSKPGPLCGVCLNADYRGRRGRDRMVVGFIATNVVSLNGKGKHFNTNQENEQLHLSLNTNQENEQLHLSLNTNKPRNFPVGMQVLAVAVLNSPL